MKGIGEKNGLSDNIFANCGQCCIKR